MKVAELQAEKEAAEIAELRALFRNGQGEGRRRRYLGLKRKYADREAPAIAPRIDLTGEDSAHDLFGFTALARRLRALPATNARLEVAHALEQACKALREELAHERGYDPIEREARRRAQFSDFHG